MSGSLTRPDYGTDIADLHRRVGILERRTTPQLQIVDELVFSYDGPLVDGTESAPKIVRTSSLLGALAVAFKPDTAGSTDTILDVLRNDTVAATVTVPASTAKIILSVNVAYSAGDTVALVVDTAGTDAETMTAAAWFT